MRNYLLFAFALLPLTVPTEAKAADGACTLSTDERAWVEGALSAAASVRTQRLHFATEPNAAIIVFNDKCTFQKAPEKNAKWKGSPHTGMIRLPDGKEIPAAVTSFSAGDDKTGKLFFVMALPSVWKAANVKGALPDSLGLKGVFIHEFMHVTQAPILKGAFDDAAARFKVPPDLSDDALQAHFKSDPAYVAVIEKERDLLYKAALEPDSAKAKAYARQAYDLVQARQARWFTGNDAVWKPYDDIFVTMEGVAQWSAYTWLSDGKGGQLSKAEAENGMRGGRRWWSQDEGLGLFLVIDRFVPHWAEASFANPPTLGFDLLKQAVSK